MAEEKLDQILIEIKSIKIKQDEDHKLLLGLGQRQDEDHRLIQKIGVTVEKVEGDVKTVAEGHQVIRREMQEMRGELKSEINFVKSALKGVSDKVNKIDRTLDEHVKLPAHAV